MHKLLLQIPILKTLIALSNLIRITQTLSILLKANIPMHQSLQTASTICTNRWLQKQIQQIANYVNQGQSLHKACTSIKFPHIPQSLLALIAIGQQTGKLETMLDKSAQLLEERLQTRIHFLLTIFQPTLLIIVGFIIAFVMLSLYLPLFNTVPHFS